MSIGSGSARISYRSLFFLLLQDGGVEFIRQSDQQRAGLPAQDFALLWERFLLHVFILLGESSRCDLLAPDENLHCKAWRGWTFPPNPSVLWSMSWPRSYRIIHPEQSLA